MEESINWKVHNSTRKYKYSSFPFLKGYTIFKFKNQFKSVYREGWLEWSNLCIAGRFSKCLSCLKISLSLFLLLSLSLFCLLGIFSFLKICLSDWLSPKVNISTFNDKIEGCLQRNSNWQIFDDVFVRTLANEDFSLHAMLALCVWWQSWNRVVPLSNLQTAKCI